MEVTLGKDAASVTLMPDGKLTALLPNDVSAENFTYDYTLETRSVEAPVEQGQVLGTITAYFNGRSYGTLDLRGHLFGGAGPLALPAGSQKFFDNLLVRILLVVVWNNRRPLQWVMFFRSRGRTGRRGYTYSGGAAHRQPPAQRLRYKNVEGAVYTALQHYYPSITPPAKAFGGKDVVQDLLTPVFTNC